MTRRLWWQKGIIYQIYPRSFYDSNGDGVGDLRGILNKLDYLMNLGVKAIWISPVYPSPMADFGYDISDYTDIDPLFGNLRDMEVLIEEVHRRDMKIILDFVPNHTSDRHPWFLESRGSRDNPKRDWYIWKDPKPDGSEPNNWLAMFGGKAWEWDEETGQYYYHAFLKEQPDLNWRNPEVQQAMLEVLRFWLDKGVDGFRVDVMWHMIKDADFRDNPVNPDYTPELSTYHQLLPVYSTDQPEVHEVVAQMRALLDEYEERMMIGEIYLPVHRLVAYYGQDHSGAHLPFNFQLLQLPWDARRIAAAVAEYEGALPEGGWPNWVLGNHDQPRIVSRVGRDQARVAAVLLLTLRGTPTLYYGDEIGMRDVPIPFDEVQDPQGLNMPGKHLSRDPSRVPMPWNQEPNAGFSTVRPWLRMDSDAHYQNVKRQVGDPHSVFSLHRRLIRLRNAERSFSEGAYIPVVADHQILSYIRHAPGADAFLIVLNLTHQPSYFNLPEELSEGGKVEISTVHEREQSEVYRTLNLYGDEALVIRLSNYQNP